MFENIILGHILEIYIIFMSNENLIHICNTYMKKYVLTLKVLLYKCMYIYIIKEVIIQSLEVHIT